MKKWFLLLAVCLVCGCHNAGPGMTFDEALKLARAQTADARYGEEWLSFNYNNRIGAKGDCYRRSAGPVRQVLVIDKDGVVTDVIADVDNAKSRCFRESYLHVRFPPPPFAPYYIYQRMS